VGFADAEAKIATAKAAALPAGPTAWPMSEEPTAEDDAAISEGAATAEEGLGGRQETTTSGEEG
jgi:hypothetical protein